MCGGARPSRAPRPPTSGPSPRVRGSLGGHGDRVGSEGSIPACAGEPKSSSTPSASPQVHPRVCGGASEAMAPGSDTLGPSPRVRGSLIRVVFRSLPCRSIPACAGEPCQPRRGWFPGWVHPRVCGGAAMLNAPTMSCMGPSPRVRGSLEEATDEASLVGSIPACAGEPEAFTRYPCDYRVHPRVCGGANSVSLPSTRSGGPSPRVRGSLCDNVAQRKLASKIDSGPLFFNI